MLYCKNYNESGPNVTFCETEWGKVEENFLMISLKDQCEYLKETASIKLRWKYMNESQNSLYIPFSTNPYSYKDQIHWALANSVFIMLMSRFWSQFQMMWNLWSTFSAFPSGSSERQHRHTQESLADLTASSSTHNAECQAGLLWYQLVSSPQQPQVYPRCYKHMQNLRNWVTICTKSSLNLESFNDTSDSRLKGLWHVQTAALLSTASPNEATLHNTILQKQAHSRTLLFYTQSVIQLASKGIISGRVWFTFRQN